MNTITATIQIFADSMGEGWNDPQTAVETYAGFLAEKLDEAAKSAGLNVEFNIQTPSNQSGYQQVQVIADDAKDEIAVQDIIRHVSEAAWDEFCASHTE